MYVPFDEMNPESRIWIYTADRTITTEEAEVIIDILEEYLNNWKSPNGMSFPSSAKVLENWFVIIVVDTTSVIDQYRIGPVDGFVFLFKEISKLTDIDFFHKPLLNYLDNYNQVQAISLFEIKQAVTDQIITPDTIIIDHVRAEQKSHLFEFERWKVRAADSWLSHYFQPQTNVNE